MAVILWATLSIADAKIMLSKMLKGCLDDTAQASVCE